MTLNQFLSTLTSDNIQVTLIDGGTNAEIITFKAPGYASLDDDIEDRRIQSWGIAAPVAIKIILEPVTTEP